MAKNTLHSFYVVLTNNSQESQFVFETCNSWGYQAVSFEVRTADGHSFTISRKPENFTKNYPSTFTIPPGEHMVFAISLNDDWNADTPLPIADATPMLVTMKAIYRVQSSPEAKQWKVWTGRAESKDYRLKLRHW